MSVPFHLDEGLRPYATDKQWKKLKAIEKHGTERAAAKVLGLHRASFYATKQAVLKKAALHGYAPDYDLVHPVPDGMKLRGVSTLYDTSGDPKIQWVKSEADKERQEDIFKEAITAMASDLPRIQPSKGPEHGSEKLMACYLVSDHHFGMLAWDEETGANYDLSISERLLTGSMDHLIVTAPPCNKASVVFLGDLLHYDSFETVTPTGRNPLDADGRFPKMVRVAIRCMRYLIESAAQRHKKVHVVVEIGNHDLSSSIFLMECLSNVYENEPRITVDTSPAHYHYFDFGKCLVGIHHGHGTKMANLPLIMATDRPEQWGAADYRYWWTGHVHIDQMKDFTGCKVESFRILAPKDAWAAEKGYRAQQDMKAIILHKDYGEVARHIVNPEMLK